MPILAFYPKLDHLDVLRACLSREQRATKANAFDGFADTINAIEALIYNPLGVYIETREKNLAAQHLLNSIDSKPNSFEHTQALGYLLESLFEWASYYMDSDSCKLSQELQTVYDAIKTQPISVIRALTKEYEKLVL